MVDWSIYIRSGSCEPRPLTKAVGAKSLLETRHRRKIPQNEN